MNSGIPGPLLTEHLQDAWEISQEMLAQGVVSEHHFRIMAGLLEAAKPEIERLQASPERIAALERVAAAAQKVFDTQRVLPQLVGPALYNELKDSLEATS